MGLFCKEGALSNSPPVRLSLVLSPGDRVNAHVHGSSTHETDAENREKQQ